MCHTTKNCVIFYVLTCCQYLNTGGFLRRLPRWFFWDVLLPLGSEVKQDVGRTLGGAAEVIISPCTIPPFSLTSWLMT